MSAPTNAGFSIEPVVTVSGKVAVLIVRGGGTHRVLGDPYEWAMVMVIDGATATLKSMVAPQGTAGLAQRRLFAHLRRDYGVERVCWERRGDNAHAVAFEYRDR